MTAAEASADKSIVHQIARAAEVDPRTVFAALLGRKGKGIAFRRTMFQIESAGVDMNSLPRASTLPPGRIVFPWAGTSREERKEQLHIARKKRWGEISPIDRFWSHVDKGGQPHPVLGTPCWLWTAYRLPTGYGRCKWQGREMTASRVSWELANGPPPEYLGVLHRCDNPPCVNPEHLFLGTALDNAVDRDAKGRREAPAGTKNGRAKISESTVIELRSQRANGASRKDLASIFGISLAAVKHILSRATWNTV